MSAGCIEHVDFASSNEISFDSEVFEEVVSGNATVPRLKMTETFVEHDIDVTEV